MKSTTIVLATALALVAAPYALAAEGTCNPTQDASYVKHPLTPGSYIFIDAREPNKLGEWTEQNGKAGLQTEKCYRGGVLRYLHDKQTDLLP